MFMEASVSCRCCVGDVRCSKGEPAGRLDGEPADFPVGAPRGAVLREEAYREAFGVRGRIGKRVLPVTEGGFLRVSTRSGATLGLRFCRGESGPTGLRARGTPQTAVTGVGFRLRPRRSGVSTPGSAGRETPRGLTFRQRLLRGFLASWPAAHVVPGMWRWSRNFGWWSRNSGRILGCVWWPVTVEMGLRNGGNFVAHLRRSRDHLGAPTGRPFLSGHGVPVGKEPREG